MAEQSAETWRGLIQGLLEDTRDLIRAELALAKAEIRDEISAVATVGASFGAAIVAATLGVALLILAIGGAIAWALSWPAWTGYAIVAVLLLAGSWFLVQYGRRRLRQIHALPKTTQTIRENLEWIQNRSVEK